MGYKKNPKLEGSGILGVIPHTGRCPHNCPDCFFQEGRSFLEPLAENLPNMPEDSAASGRIVRVNDGHDSNVKRKDVMEACQGFPMRFYNTAIPHFLDDFDAPVVLTLNPGNLTDKGFHRLDKIPSNLMFVRLRVNTWNLDMVEDAIEYYTSREVPVVLTFMAYFKESIPEDHQHGYIFRKRTLNNYWAITTKTWREVMARFQDNVWVHSCGHIEGEKGNTKCRHCGNCVREYFATTERLRKTV